MSSGTRSRQRFLALHGVLRERIALLHYPPGTRLREQDLATEFHVSRTPIRQVLQRLEYEGLVVTRHGVGTTVTNVDIKGLREIYSLRMRLAELIGDLSPRAPSTDVVAELDAIAERCLRLAQRFDPEEFGRLNIAVHQQILQLIGNRPLREATDVLFYRTARMWLQLMPELDQRTETEQFHHHVRLIAEAARNGDTRGVGYLLRNAIATVLVRFGQILGAAHV